MMRKTITANFALLAALFILVLFLPGSAVAAGEKALSATKLEGDVGSKVVLIVKGENLQGSEGGQFTLTFDHSLVKPITIEPGDLILSSEGNLHMANLEYAPGELIFMWVTASADTKESGSVCLITFELHKEGVTTIGFKDLIIVDGSGETPKSVAGQIKIGPAGSGPGQESDSEESDSSTDDEEAGEELIGEEEMEDDETIVIDRVGVNPFLILMPIIIIVALTVAYFVVKGRGKNH
jgi:hypothetical protein